jgi:hypothetical protein
LSPGRALALLAVSLGPLSVVSESSGMQPVATWMEVREQAACEAMRDDYCLGRYGFTIKANGRFTAGPSERGSKVEGSIEAAELQRIGSLVGDFAPELAHAQRTCMPRGVPGIRDQLDITFSDGTVVRAYDLGGVPGKVCYVGAWDRVQVLHEYVRGLMSRYYPVPFPAR